MNFVFVGYSSSVIAKDGDSSRLLSRKKKASYAAASEVDDGDPKIEERNEDADSKVKLLDALH